MNRAFSYFVTIILSVVFTLIGDITARAPKLSADDAEHATNAAFRDGSFQARLDLENGRKPHLSVGRWSTDEDRASYIAGYEQAYVHSLCANSEKLSTTAPSDRMAP